MYWAGHKSSPDPTRTPTKKSTRRCPSAGGKRAWPDSARPSAAGRIARSCPASKTSAPHHSAAAAAGSKSSSWGSCSRIRGAFQSSAVAADRCHRPLCWKSSRRRNTDSTAIAPRRVRLRVGRGRRRGWVVGACRTWWMVRRSFRNFSGWWSSRGRRRRRSRSAV